MSYQVTTHDMYEAAYYLTLGGKVASVFAAMEFKKRIFKFIIAGDELQKGQLDFFNGAAVVNLMEFRRCYKILNSYLGSARKEYAKGGVQ